jgi:hypothetical protein
MPIKVYKDSSELKHQYAHNELGLPVHIKDAEKYINGQKAKYYLFEDKQIEIILRDGEKNSKHFAIKSDAEININGKKYNYNQISESIQHIDFKIKLKKEGYFYWNDYLVFIENTKMEAVIYGSRFKADLFARLNDGTPVVIEVIKTSETSKSKKQYLNKNEILTFEIYIDDEGNQVNERFNIFGNREIESIEAEITRQQQIFNNSESERKSAWSGYYYEKDRNDREIKEYEDKINQEIQRYFERIQYRIKIESGKRNTIQEKIRQSIKNTRALQDKFRKDLNYRHGLTHEYIGYLREFRDGIKKAKSDIESSKDLLQESQGMESLFIQVAPLVKWQWVEPGCTKEPQGQDRLFRLKYWMT